GKSALALGGDGQGPPWKAGPEGGGEEKALCPRPLPGHSGCEDAGLPPADVRGAPGGPYGGHAADYADTEKALQGPGNVRRHPAGDPAHLGGEDGSRSDI